MSTKNLRNWSDPEIAEEAMKVLRTEIRQGRRGSRERHHNVSPARQDRCIPVGRWTLHHRALTGRNHYRDAPSPRPSRTRNEPSRAGGGHRRERGREDDLEHRAPPAAPPSTSTTRTPSPRASATRTIRSSRPRRGRSSTRPSRHGFGATSRSGSRAPGQAHRDRPSSDEPMARATKPMPCSSVPAIRTSTCNACGAVSLREGTTSPKARSGADGTRRGRTWYGTGNSSTTSRCSTTPDAHLRRSSSQETPMPM